MALTGNALLAIWHDIERSAEAEYMEWHTREHMPERLSIPGFTVGKRLINHDLDRYRYGTIYGGENLEVFRAPAYLERLNNPTPWSLRVQPTFRNFLRVACVRLASRGIGEGGAVATVRLDFADGAGEGDLSGGADSLAGALLEITGVCCAHVALAHPEVSGVRTRETEIRPKMSERAFEALVLVEGSGRPELEAVLPEIERTRHIERVRPEQSGIARPHPRLSAERPRPGRILTLRPRCGDATNNWRQRAKSTRGLQASHAAAINSVALACDSSGHCS